VGILTQWWLGRAEMIAKLRLSGADERLLRAACSVRASRRAESPMGDEGLEPSSIEGSPRGPPTGVRVLPLEDCLEVLLAGAIAGST
jgi:hypothetical protein